MEERIAEDPRLIPQEAFSPGSKNKSKIWGLFRLGSEERSERNTERNCWERCQEGEKED